MSRSRARSAFGIFVLLVALIAIGMHMADQWDEVFLRLESMRLSETLLAVLLACVMLSFSALSFSLLAHPEGHSHYLRARTSLVFLIAQPLKYLPGRFWAVLYQVAKVRETVGTQRAVAATMSHLVVTIVVSILVFGLANEAALPIFLAGVLLSFIWIKRGGVGPYFFFKIIDMRLSLSHTMFVAAAILAEWIFFVAVSWAICVSLSEQITHILILAAFYAVSWIFGSVIAVAPGGLGVREGSFVTLSAAAGIAPEFAASYAILARLVFLLAEATTAVFALVVIRYGRGLK